MPSLSDIKQSKFLKQSDVTPPKLVTIAGYSHVNVAADGADEDKKYCLSFHELDKPMVLNSTNGQIIAKISNSEDFDHWIGAKVVLFNDPNVSFGGRLTGGIRVRAPKPQAGTGLAPATPKPTLATLAPKPAPAPASTVPETYLNPEDDPNHPDFMPF